MTNKMTKNDSMSIREQKFYVVAASFKALLLKRGLYESYFREWTKYNWYENDVKDDILWERWAAQKPAYEWVIDAFAWSLSKIPSDVWHALHIDWNKYYDKNLNK